MFKKGHAKSNFKSMKGNGKGTVHQFSTNRICQKCGKEYLPKGPKQRWCLECIPNIKHRPIINRYNMSYQEYQAFMRIHSGLCCICLKKEAKVIDHCHKTNKVRGLICQHCNSLLPLVENKDLLARAIKYIEERG